MVVDERDVHVTSVLTKRHEHAVLEDNADLDDTTLGALGYKQEFKRQANRLRCRALDLTIGQGLHHL